MWRLVLLGLALLTWGSDVLADTSPPAEKQTVMRRALLVGIDLYQPVSSTEAPPQGTETTGAEVPTAVVPPVRRDAWVNLDGAVNDVAAMREILLARYGFKPENILVLKNEEATHERILTAIRTQLIEPSTRGDVVLFMYSGHGSQVTNSLSPELDKKDETIVPADANSGAWDIRDKELRRLFNDVLDKGAQLTVIIDSCHSGSVVRGLVPPEKTRNLPADPRDIASVVANEPGDSRPAPEARGALIFSAAQDDQPASEATDTERNIKHGAFSLALLRVLKTVDVYEPAERVFLRVKALLQTSYSRQEPVLAGPADHRQQPLFGASAGDVSGRPTVAVLRIQASGVIELQGGWAIGLRKDSELIRVATETGQPPVRVRVEQVEGWNKALARVSAGHLSSVQVGDLFVMDNWVAPEDVLQLWLPPATLDVDALVNMAQGFAALQKSNRLAWVDDPTEVPPTHVVSWNGTHWQLTRPDGKTVDLGKTPTPQGVSEKLTEHGAASETVRLFVHFPPPRELANGLQTDGGKPTHTVAFVPTPQQAHYVLVGRLQGNEIQYALVLPTLTRGEAETKTPLPVRTDWVPISTAPETLPRAAGTLTRFARRLSQIRGWLQLTAPPNDGGFPYTLALRDKKRGNMVTPGAVVEEGDQLEIILRADADALKRSVKQRYVYAFILDSTGKTTLLYPPGEQGNVENRFPQKDALTQPPAEIPLKVGFEIEAPFGLDTYFLITSKDALPNPDILAGEGVRTRQEQESPLARLLADLAAGEQRGARLPTPTSWSLERLMLRSKPKSAQ